MTVESSGTQTAVINTEHTLVSLTGNKVCTLIVDTLNMASGDTLELSVKTKVLSGSSLGTVYFKRFFDAQPSKDRVKASIPLPSDIQIDFTLKQTAGTGRAFAWKVISI